MEPPKRPVWLPDTQGFLATAIIVLIAAIVMLLLLRPIQLDAQVAGMLMALIGLLSGCLKDVYSFFFGSSTGSKDKDQALITKVIAPPTAPVSTTTTVTDASTVTKTEPATDAKPAV